VITREHLRLVNRIQPKPGRLSVDLGQLIDENKALDDMLHDVERRILAEALERAAGQTEVAAALLGLTPSALEKRLRDREVPPSQPDAA
jgi:DNA-binding NtrC family response regulator